MVRVISQETYDDLVKENIEDLEMTPEEAISDAIAQLEAQGVDLSNIIKDLAITTGHDHIVTATIRKIKDDWSTNKTETDEIVKHLMILKSECDTDIARKVRAGKDGAYELLLDMLEKSLEDNQDSFTILVLNTLCSLMEMQPDLLTEKGVHVINRILVTNKIDNILISTLKWTSACCLKHEKNRQDIFLTGITNNIKSLLKKKDNSKLTSEVLQVIRRLCLDDDVRVPYGKAHEHSRELAIYTLDSLIDLLKENTKPPLASELMLTIATLLVRHEFCQTVADAGAVDVLVTMLKENYTHAGIVQQAFKLVTALAGNDDVKRSLIKSGLAPLVVSIINENIENQTVVPLGLKCIASLALREPSHSLLFIENGGPEVIAEAMEKYPENASIQKNACYAIRNMVARCKEYNNKFLQLGVEQYLNEAYKRYEKEFGFDIKSALRDLECDVKLQEQWTGKGVQLRND